MASRKGVAIHVEMVLSFIIFVGFVIFILAAFPVYKSSKSSVGLDSAERSISDFVKFDVKYFTVVLNRTIAADCFCFQSDSELGKVIAVNEAGETVSASYSNGEVCVKSKEVFNSIYSSPEFKENSFDFRNCDSLNKSTNDYLTGIEDDVTMVSYNKILNLISLYDSGYETLKDSFGIPDKEDFGFRVVNLKGEDSFNLQAIKTRPAKTEVLARNVPAQIAYENGSFVFGMINVQSW